MDWSKKRILVTGGRGFLGSHVIKELQKKNAVKILIPSSQDVDLRLSQNCKKVVQDVDVIFHLAANSGGIGLNLEKPGEIFYDNLMMDVQLLHEAKESGVEKFVALGTICSYPKFTPIPFSEDSIWDGYPEETNAPYGLAKKMILVQSQAYRQQYNFKSIVLLPTNLYGPGDSFDSKYANVIPSLISKISYAKKCNDRTITLWGDGTPTRDFLYVEDAARGIIMAAEKYDADAPINLSSDEEVSIKELASLICELMEFKVDIQWDVSKPNGQPRRKVSNRRAEEKFGFKPEISLREGLKRTIDWYLLNYVV